MTVSNAIFSELVLSKKACINIIKSFLCIDLDLLVKYKKSHGRYCLNFKNGEMLIISSDAEFVFIHNCDQGGGNHELKKISKPNALLNSLDFIVDKEDLLEEVINHYDFEFPHERKLEGWRLPSKAELIKMHNISKLIPGEFKDGCYMTSESSGSYKNWIFEFKSSKWIDAAIEESHWGTAWIRLVKDRS